MTLHALTTLAINSDGIALTIVFCLLSLVAFIAIFFKSVRQQNSLFAPCIIIITLVFTIIGVGLISTVAYRAMGY